MKITLKALRVNANMSQDDAAKSLNVSKRTLQHWEMYKTYPTGPQLASICNLYKCTFDDIFLPSALTESE